MIGKLMLKDGYIREVHFRLTEETQYIKSLSYENQNVKVSVTSNRSSLHCELKASGCIAEIGKDGILKVVQPSDGTIKVIKHSFVCEPGKPLNGVLFFSTNGRTSSVAFHNTSFEKFIHDRKIMGAYYANPNGEFVFGSKEKIITDGKIDFFASLKNGLIPCKVSGATYLFTQSSWVEDNCSVYKSSLLSKTHPFELDLSKIDSNVSQVF